MGMQLEVVYAALQEAAQATNNAKEELESAFQNLQGSFDNLGSSFLGKAASALMGFWMDAGIKILQGIFKKMEKKNDKLKKIAELIQQSDEATAALFNIR